MGEAAIVVRGLRKSFGAKEAVASIDLDVAAGSCAGLVGPNGAGKTTSLSMMTGLMRPDAGQVAVGGIGVWPDPRAAKAVIGVVPAGARLFDRLSGAELLEYAGRLRGLPAAEARSRAGQLLGVLDLTADAGRLVADYSTGMRKKAALGCALIHNPPVLFLDEPLEGVDPVSADVIRRLLARLAASGSTVLFSSHVMELVEQICDHVSIIDKGRIVASGPIRQVRHGKTLQQAFMDLIGARAGGEDGLSWLGCRGWAHRRPEAAVAGQRGALLPAGQDRVHAQHHPGRGGGDHRVRQPGRAARPGGGGGRGHGRLHHLRVRLAGPADLRLRPGRHPGPRHAGPVPAAGGHARRRAAGRLGHRGLAAGQRARPARGGRRAGPRRGWPAHRAGRGAAAGAVLHHPGPVRDHRPGPAAALAPWQGPGRLPAAADLRPLPGAHPGGAEDGLRGQAAAGALRRPGPLAALAAAGPGRACGAVRLGGPDRRGAAVPAAARRHHRGARLALDRHLAPGPDHGRHHHAVLRRPPPRAAVRPARAAWHRGRPVLDLPAPRAKLADLLGHRRRRHDRRVGEQPADPVLPRRAAVQRGHRGGAAGHLPFQLGRDDRAGVRARGHDDDQPPRAALLLLRPESRPQRDRGAPAQRDQLRPRRRRRAPGGRVPRRGGGFRRHRREHGAEQHLHGAAALPDGEAGEQPGARRRRGHAGRALAATFGSLLGTAVAVSPVAAAEVLSSPGPAAVRIPVLLLCAAGYGVALAGAGVRIAARMAEPKLPELCQIAVHSMA